MTGGPGSGSGPDAAAAVQAYARDFLAAVPDGHSVTSPLGAWLLLTLTGGDTGVDTGARAAADGLLAHPHPAVSAAVAAWSAPDVETPALAAWRAGLHRAATGPIPTQQQADSWAERETQGLIPRFPLALDPATVLVLANALATRVSWVEPFVLVPGAELDGPLADGTERALWAADRPGHRILLAHTAIGLVGVHVGESTGDDGRLLVVSVLADPSAEPAAVHQAALDIAAMLAGRESGAREVDVFDAPLAGPGWTIEEGVATTSADVDRVRTARAVLPAWSATTDLDLLPGDGTAYGLHAAVRALERLLPPEQAPFVPSARQSAVARFSRLGFEAAAVSAIAMARAAMPKQSRQVPARTLTVRFGHPYAVCAVAVGDGPWHGVPVFSAWVERCDPVTASEGRADG